MGDITKDGVNTKIHLFWQTDAYPDANPIANPDDVWDSCCFGSQITYINLFHFGVCDKCITRLINTTWSKSCILYNDKYMITSTQITITEIFAFIAVLV